MYKINKKLIFGVLATIAVLAIALRLSLWQFVSDDYTYFLSPWYDYLAAHGLEGLKDNFANYNMPYLYMLYILTNIAIPKLLAIKLLSILFDIALAVSIFLVVKHFKPKSYTPYFAGVASLFVPTILFNSALWGQCDAIFTSFIVLSFWAILKDKRLLIWVFWGIAFSFKLQAIFFLPILAYSWFLTPNKNLTSYIIPLSALGVFIASIIPAMVIGRPLDSLLSIYAGQTSGGFLTLNAASLYQWIPNDYFLIFNKAGVLLAAAIILLTLLVALTKYNVREKSVHLLLVTTLVMFIVPFLLPQMHERYFYIAEVFAFIMAFAFSLKYATIAVVSQLTGLFAYMPFLFKIDPPLSMPVVALVQLLVIIGLYFALLTHGKPAKKLV